MRHAFVHFELNTSAPAEARSFYETLFDWSFVEVAVGEDASYVQIHTPSGLDGGLLPNPTPSMPSQWVPYVGVPNVKATVAKVRKMGGEVVVDHTLVPGFGALAIVKDPGGTQIGLWEVGAEEKPAVVEKVEAKPAVAKKKTAKKKTAKKKTAKKKTAKKKTAARKGTKRARR